MIVTPNGATNVYNGTTLNNASYSTNPANYTITGFQNSDTANSIGLAFTGTLLAWRFEILAKRQLPE